MIATSTGYKAGGILDQLSRRDFFTFCKKDVLKDVVHACNNFNAEVKKAEPKPTCEELAFQLFGKKSGKSFLTKKKLFSRKEGFKI
jgi:hypothetical protein